MMKFGVRKSNILNLFSKKLMLMEESLDGKAMDIARQVHEKAMENLESSLGTGYTGIEYGHSQDIRQRIGENVEFKRHGPTRIEVIYHSPHAEVVEFGHTKTGTELVTSNRPFPIGQQQGWSPPIFRTEFRVQPGYFYLTRAKIEVESQLPSNLASIFKKLVK